ncbi:uncharacterized protein UTRI_05552 [Ustilago trichophora]|uniref:Uncharacterized protein n=1 Tax=Ustilago trichophora TaxID=86804 RepID=A0A5C3EHI2_9BASI|nr:uncharacterized protein UTRI_05552 [Ustilago trichophora]
MRNTIINLSSDKEIASTRQALELKAHITNGGEVEVTRMDEKVDSVDVEVEDKVGVVISLVSEEDDNDRDQLQDQVMQGSEVLSQCKTAEVSQCLAKIRTGLNTIEDERIFDEAITNFHRLVTLLSKELPGVDPHKLAVSTDFPSVADDDQHARRLTTQTTAPPAVQRPSRLPPSQRSPAARVVWNGIAISAPDSPADRIRPASHRSSRLPPPSQRSPTVKVAYKGQTTTPSTLLGLTIGSAAPSKKNKKKKSKHLPNGRMRKDGIRGDLSQYQRSRRRRWAMSMNLKNVVEKKKTTMEEEEAGEEVGSDADSGDGWLGRCRKKGTQKTMTICRRLAGFTQDDDADGIWFGTKGTQKRMTAIGSGDGNRAMGQDVSVRLPSSSSAASSLEPNPRKRKRASSPPPLNEDTASNLEVHHPVRLGGGGHIWRKFRIPPDARNNRSKASDYPRIGEPLEPGFVKATQSCTLCRQLGIWCTYGDGKNRYDKPRREEIARCDRCVSLGNCCSHFSLKRSYKNRPLPHPRGQ